jgi:hypothetical protein
MAKPRRNEWPVSPESAFDNKTVADALMDRVIHGSYHIQLAGESMRQVRSLSASIARKQ